MKRDTMTSCFRYFTKQDNDMNIWRITGVAVMAGLALFLVFTLLKLLLVALVAALLLRVIGGRLMSRMAGLSERGRVGQSTDIIAIDNPAYQFPMNRTGFGRVIPIS
jgi:flagellar biosynthesis protein FlhB